MKIQSTPRDDHQVKLVVEVENEQLERKMRKAARHISEHAKIPGFRPGKAPFDVVVRYAGEETVRQEAVEMLVDEIYPEVLKEQNIEPGGMGSLEDIVSMDPLTLSFIVPLSPSVDLGKYLDVRVPYTAPVLDEAKVDDSIERYRNYYATMEPVEGAAAEGNVVYIRISGTSDGEELVPERALQVKITEAAKESETEWPFKGFGRKLIGLKADDEKSVSKKYDADFSDEKLKGRKVEWKVKVQSVKNQILPELTTEFVKNFGEYESVDAFRDEVRQMLNNDLQAEYDFNFYKDVLAEIKKTAVVKYPPQMLEDEKEQMLHDFTHELSHQRMDLDTYLKVRNTTKEELIEKEITPQAIDRLERSLIMREIAQTEKIQLSEEEIQTGYNEALNDLAQSQNLDELVKKNKKDKVVNAIAMEGASRMMNRRTYETLKAIATGVYKSTSETAAVESADAEKPVEEKPKTRKTKAKVAKEEAAPAQGE